MSIQLNFVSARERRILLAVSIVALGYTTACRPIFASPRVKSTGISQEELQCSTRWSTPDTLKTRDGRPVAIDLSLGVARMDSTLAMLGSPVWTRETSPASRLVLADVMRNDMLGVLISPSGMVDIIRKPPFMKLVFGVFAIPSRSGGIHVVWGVPPDSNAFPMKNVESVWYAHFDGREWSQPELVLKHPAITWLWSSVADVINGDVVVAATASDDRWDGILVARRRAPGWETTRLATLGPFPSQWLSMPTDGSNAAIIYPEFTSSGGVNSASVFVRELLPSGGWSDARLVQSMGSGPVWPKVKSVRSADGMWHAFWTFRRAAGDSYYLFHVSSRDLRQWSPLDSIRIAAAGVDYRVVAEGTSGARAIWRDGNNGGASASWTGNRRGESTSLPFAGVATPISATAISRDTIVVTWGNFLPIGLTGTAINMGLVSHLSKGVVLCR